MTTNFPERFKARMQSRLGEEWNDFEQAHLESPPVSIRVNPKKSAQLPWETSPIPWTDLGRYLNQRPSFTLDPFFHAGAYYVQEASSMLLEQAIRQHVPNTALRALDLCAAPGGKSTHVLSLLHPDSLLVSNEVIRSRVNVLSENIQKWGYPNVVVTNSDPADFSRLRSFFDLMVVDAPCSGEGLFRKDPEAMAEWSEENVRICRERQERIVRQAWPALKENGILIYSTCTYNEEEDEGVLSWIDENFKPEFLSLKTDAWNVERLQRGQILAYRCYPHRVKGEGFFISVMRKLNDAEEAPFHAGKNLFATPEKRNLEIVKQWVSHTEMKYFQRNDLIQVIHQAHADSVAVIAKNLRVQYAGVFVGVVKQNKIVPEHSLAISTVIEKNAFPTVELDHNEALRYLRKDSLTIDTPEKGYALATFQNIPLGWMNLLTGRMNNLYPQEWRIRMQLK